MLRRLGSEDRFRLEHLPVGLASFVNGTALLVSGGETSRLY
jgi:hypothetical protein